MDTNDPKVTRKVRSYTMTIDRSVCIGASTCVALAPKAYALDSEAKATYLDTVDQESDEALIDAAKGCPVGAIKIVDDKGKQIFP